MIACSRRLLLLLLLWAAAPGSLLEAQTAGATPSPARRGEVVFRAAGGCGCHTDYERDGPRLAGGKPIKTPFGTFYGTNITPDPEHGLGKWNEADFLRAMTEGQAPDGSHYFPVFPYPSFTRMTRGDLSDLWAYLRTVKPVPRANRPHDVPPPFRWRFGAAVWKALFFRPGPFRPEPGHPAQWSRGAYLVTAVGHCGECHTPRRLSGAPKANMFLAGSLDGPEGQLAPNITPHRATGIGDWSDADLIWFLQTGGYPDGEQAEGLMAEVIEHGYGELGEADLRAILVYLKSLPPIRNRLAK